MTTTFRTSLATQIRVVKADNSYQVVEGTDVHASFSYSQISPTSRYIAELRAEAFAEGVRYTRTRLKRG